MLEYLQSRGLQVVASPCGTAYYIMDGILEKHNMVIHVTFFIDERNRPSAEATLRCMIGFWSHHVFLLPDRAQDQTIRAHRGEVKPAMLADCIALAIDIVSRHGARCAILELRKMGYRMFRQDLTNKFGLLSTEVFIIEETRLYFSNNRHDTVAKMKTSPTSGQRTEKVAFQRI